VPGAEALLVQRARDPEIGPTHAADAGAAEDDVRIPLHVQEVRAAQVRVAFVVSRPDARGIDRRLDRRGARRIVRVEVELAAHLPEQAAHVRDHHVPHRKGRGGMSWFEYPAGHVRFLHPFPDSPARSKY
jgi:hypothetical protein